MEFRKKLEAAWRKNSSFVSIGLDPDLSLMPSSMSALHQPFLEFNKRLIDATHDLVCAYKINTAFYEATGSDGIAQLKHTMEYLQANYPDIPTIIDAKRADIGNTNRGTVSFVFEYLGGDSITVNPYMGKESLEPFLAQKDKGIFVLCRTSNPGAGEFQDLLIDGVPLYQRVTKQVVSSWNTNQNCCLVIGATYPQELSAVRQQIDPDITILMPGIGAQGGDAKLAVQAALNSHNSGIIVSASRAVIYASNGDNFASAAREQALLLRNKINTYRS